VDDKWQDEAHHDVLNETIAFVPDRFFRQARSASGKLAYVIFGASESSGVYYNWCVKCPFMSTAPDLFIQASSQALSLIIPL
jgi:hypothetical protein